MSCNNCPGCGQFCDYPYCTGVPRPPERTAEDEAHDREQALAWASDFAARRYDQIKESLT